MSSLFSGVLLLVDMRLVNINAEPRRTTSLFISRLVTTRPSVCVSVLMCLILRGKRHVTKVFLVIFHVNFRE